MRRLLLLLVILALTGCGNDRTRPPDLGRSEAPARSRPYDLPAAGVIFDGPANWQVLAPQGTLTGGIRSRTATVAVWRYVRAEPLPPDRAALEETRGRLVGRIKQRDPAFRLRSRRIVRRGGARGIEIVGRQTMAGRRYGVRSSHLYKAGAEIVVDAYAPPKEFARLDRTVFLPLLRTLKLRTP